MPAPKDSFGVQAAKFSLYAPAVAFALGLVMLGQPSDASTAAARSMASVKIGIAFINMGLIGIGLILGVTALVSMRKYGTAGILVRAIIGVSVNLLLVLLMVGVLFLPMLMAHDLRGRVVGHWRGPQATPAQELDLAFAADGTFTANSAPGANNLSLSLAGHWTFSNDQVLALKVERVDLGNPKAAGQEMLLGRVRRANDSEMVLVTDHGEEQYARQ